MRLSEKLIQLRKDKGWTQAVAARNIDIQQSYLSKLENGRYIPSDEVIDKLCKAYDVPKNDLVITNEESTTKKHWLLGALFGVLLSVLGYFGLLFPQTYYTYQVTPVGETDSANQNLNYHLTDQYNGERYVTTFSSIQYEYVLIAERDILRDENRWMIAIGLIILLLSVAYPLVRLVIPL